MAGLVPAIHVSPLYPVDMDARNKSGHDGGRTTPLKRVFGTEHEVPKARGAFAPLGPLYPSSDARRASVAALSSVPDSSTTTP